jgi:hypothetical protein
MKINKVMKSLGIIYVCVSESHAPSAYFFAYQGKQVEQIEQCTWEKVHQAKEKKLLFPGDLCPAVKEQIMALVMALIESLPQTSETKTNIDFRGKKNIRYIPIKKKIYRS